MDSNLIQLCYYSFFKSEPMRRILRYRHLGSDDSVVMSYNNLSIFKNVDLNYDIELLLTYIVNKEYYINHYNYIKER